MMTKLSALAPFLLATSGLLASATSYGSVICNDWQTYSQWPLLVCHGPSRSGSLSTYDASRFPGAQPLTITPCVGWIGDESGYYLCHGLEREVTVPSYTLPPDGIETVAMKPCLRWYEYIQNGSSRINYTCREVGTQVYIPRLR